MRITPRLFTGINLSRLLGLAVAAALVLVAGATFAPQGPAHADELDDTIAAMLQAAKDKDSGACIAKMIELQDKPDASVGKALNKLVKNRDTTIAAAAVRQLGLRKDETLGKSVGKKIGDKNLYKEEDKRDLYVAYLDAAAMYANPKHGKELEDIVKKFMQSDAEFASKAVKAYGSVREKEVVDELIKWLIQTESTGQSQGGKNPSQETKDNLAKVKSQIIATLEELTMQPIGDGKSWEEFWDKKRKKFEFPDPNAAEVDPATLDEWSDVAYGYTVKKPEGEDWGFRNSDHESVRMRLERFERSEKPEEGDYVELRIDFLIHNLSSQQPKSIKELAAWYAKEFAEARFSDLRGKEPEVVERKIGGRDFFVISAKGEAGGGYKSWGTAEMRAYLTQVGHIVVRMEGTARLGAEPDDIAKLWQVIEGAEWEAE